MLTLSSYAAQLFDRGSAGASSWRAHLSRRFYVLMFVALLALKVIAEICTRYDGAGEPNSNRRSPAQSVPFLIQPLPLPSVQVGAQHPRFLAPAVNTTPTSWPMPFSSNFDSGVLDDLHSDGPRPEQ